MFEMHKFNFTNRVISIWNTLPDIALSANTRPIDTFKARLDRFWSDRELNDDDDDDEIQLEIRYYNRKSKSS